MAFDTVLVANRGEIAVRVIRSARAAGLRTVAVHSDADADAPHVRAADVAVRIGPAPAQQSYLDVDALLAAARDTGAGAVHPGYGFLSENAGFARAVLDAGLVWVGPPPEAIEAMGDKAAAKRLLEPAGVPLLPGYQGEAQDDATLLTEARRIGLPLMVKAAAGGGGKGMRLVTSAEDLPGALAAARREAAAAFGDDGLLLERALVGPRHVEVQVLADAHGTTLALGERDCSVQRRHQKVVEEAPSPGLDEDVRRAMQAAAVAAAEAVGYVGAGTVEFLLDPASGEFAFLEMNTRLQVEHPVTELVTGLDLVDLQLRVAAGHPLPLGQDDVEVSGHAIEVRLYAEDPGEDYLPQTGTLHAWRPVEGLGLRTDAGVTVGSEVTAHYDPMLAKLVAHGRDRDEARRRLLAAVEGLVALGVTTNRGFLARVLADEVFASAAATTAFLDERDVTDPEVTDVHVAAVAGWWHLHRSQGAARRAPGLGGWSNAPWLRSRQRLLVGDDVREVVVADDRGRLSIMIDGGGPFEVLAHRRGVTVDGEPVTLDAVAVGDARVLVRFDRVDLDVVDVLLAPPGAADAAGAGVLTAPMHGVVVAVEVAEGDRVATGDPVLVVEAMKMEHVLRADVDGFVAEVIDVAAQVAGGDVVARIEPDDEVDR